VIGRAVDVPIQRRDVLEHLARDAPKMFHEIVSVGKGRSLSDWPDLQAAERLAQDEYRCVHDAELFYVSPEMMEVSKTAAQSFPIIGLAADDLPSQIGFCVFATPIAWTPLPAKVSEVLGLDRASRMPVVAASWRPVTWEATWSGVWITWYTAPNDMVPPTGIRHPASICMDNDATIPFSEVAAPGFEALMAGRSENPFVDAAFTLWTIWSLMGQNIALDNPAAYDRASSRRVQRELGKVPNVRVISLRRSYSDTNESGNSDHGNTFHHQWIVRGHWRQQWYPSRGVNRPVWIAPHLKGPEGAPLIGGERVYALKR
jgi:hypothetical protein